MIRKSLTGSDPRAGLLTFREEGSFGDETIHFVLLTESRPEGDPLSAARMYLITPDGALFFEQRSGALLQSVSRSYYMSGLSMLIRYPYRVDYDAVLAVLEES